MEPPADDKPTGESDLELSSAEETEVLDVEDEDAEPGAMTFLDHLEELRWTLAKCLGSFVIACILIAVFVFQFADLLRWPYDFAVRGFPEVNDELYIRGFMGSFSVMFQLFFLGGLALSLPFMLVFLGQFIAPGLTKSEKRMLLPGSIAAVVLFLTGATFSFFILLPAGLRASVMVSQLFGFNLLIDAPAYYGLLMWATAGVGAAFEFPLVLLILIHLGIVSTDLLAKYRRHAIVGFLALSAIVTPTPDPITFLFLAGPLWALYEVAILFGRRLEKRRKESLEAEEIEDDA